MKINSNRLRAAQKFCAKNDAREYITGIHINNKFIEATNGHIAVRMKNDARTRMDVIVRFSGAITSKAQITKLEFNNGACVAYHYDGMGMLVGVQSFEVISGRFPNVDRIIPAELAQGEYFPAIDVKYLSIFEKAFKHKSLRFLAAICKHYTDKKSNVVFGLNGIANEIYGNPLIVVMPIGVD